LDRTSGLMPGILSDEPIGDWRTVGTVIDPEIVNRLNEAWVTQMKTATIVLPFEKSENLGPIRMYQATSATAKVTVTK
jgi:hypothetical protein